MYKVETSAQASEVLDAIEENLSSFAHPSDIQKVFAKIFSAIDGLEEMPGRHGPYQAGTRLKREVRRVSAEKYVVYFTIDEALKLVEVIDVQHRRRSSAFLYQRLR